MPLFTSGGPGLVSLVLVLQAGVLFLLFWSWW